MPGPRGTYVDPHASKTTFGPYADTWLKSRNHELTTAAQDASIMGNHVLARWRDVPHGKIDHSAVQAWITDLGKRLSPATVIECHRLLSGVMKSAVRDRLIGANPCEGVRLPKRRRQDDDDRIITREQFTALLRHVPDRYRAVVALAAGADLRWGECAGQRWDAVDLDAGTVRVLRVAAEVNGHVSIKPYPKSRAGRREVPLPRSAVDLLTAHRDAFRAGLLGSVVPPGSDFVGTWLVSEGVPVNDVAGLIGREQISTTLNRYTHASRDRNNRARAVFADFSLTPASEPSPEAPAPDLDT
ncbi:tyrosine-type recombinase/integrase [Nonomuraea sp. NPDC050383]|uniref:tyrosine-type recombinase/integrase n=1 Tax=Nonomuraea sp. NPDC050383 TaxID=3364362 RepID=UPI00379A4C4E